MADSETTRDDVVQGAAFVAVGENGLRSFSSDGLAWTAPQTDREGVLLSQVCIAGGVCVAAGRYGGERLVFATRDGREWRQAKVPGRPYVTRLEILFRDGDEFAAVMNEDGASPGLIRSSDGIAWSERTPLLDDPKVMRHDAHLRRIAQSADRLVVVGDYGARLVRLPGQQRLQADPQAVARDTLIDVAFGNGAFVGGGLHGLRMRSEDGLAWTDRQAGEEGEHINAMIFDGRQFVGIGQGATYFSPDGRTWRRVPNHQAPTAAALGADAAGKPCFIGVLWPGRMLRSTDAVHWTPVHEFPHHVLGLAYGRLGT